MKVTSLRYLDAKFHHPSPKIKKIPKNTNGRLAIPALAGLLVLKGLLTYVLSKFYEGSPTVFLRQDSTAVPFSLIRQSGNLAEV